MKALRNYKISILTSIITILLSSTLSFLYVGKVDTSVIALLQFINILCVIMYLISYNGVVKVTNILLDEYFKEERNK